MRILTICLIAFTALGCKQIIGLDEFEVEEEGQGIEGEGEPCNVVLFDVATMEGVCTPKEVPPENCPGGTYPNDESGNCPNPGELKCCIFEDQCQKFEMVGLWCDEQDCAPFDGWKMGCPTGMWCCGDLGIMD